MKNLGLFAEKAKSFVHNAEGALKKIATPGNIKTLLEFAVANNKAQAITSKLAANMPTVVAFVGSKFGARAFSCATPFLGYIVAQAIWMIPVVYKYHHLHRDTGLAKTDALTKLAIIEKKCNDPTFALSYKDAIDLIIADIEKRSFVVEHHLFRNKNNKKECHVMQLVNEKVAEDMANINNPKERDNIIKFWRQDPLSIYATLEKEASIEEAKAYGERALILG